MEEREEMVPSPGFPVLGDLGMHTLVLIEPESHVCSSDRQRLVSYR